MGKRKQKQTEQTAVAEQPATPPQPKRGLSATMARYRGAYADGRSCGDATAIALAGMSLATILAAAEVACGLEPGALAAKYAGLNNGQQRMCAGNRLRAASRKAVAAEIAALLPKD